MIWFRSICRQSTDILLYSRIESSRVRVARLAFPTTGLFTVRPRVLLKYFERMLQITSLSTHKRYHTRDDLGGRL